MPVLEVFCSIVIVLVLVSLFPSNENTDISGDIPIESLGIQRGPGPLIPISEASYCHLLEFFKLSWKHCLDGGISPALTLFSELLEATSSLLVVFRIVCRRFGLLDSDIFFEKVPEHASSHTESDRAVSCLENFEALEGFFFCEWLVCATFYSEYVIGDHKRKIRIRGRLESGTMSFVFLVGVRD